MSVTWHPFAEKFPLLTGKEMEALEESLKETKGNKDNPVLYRLVKGKKEFLDGRNRMVACEKLNLKCQTRAVNVPDDKIKSFIIRHNVTRRHLGEEFRKELVSELRSEGQSIRQISETLGVPKSTAARDVAKNRENESSTVPFGTVETVIGKDKKVRQARQPRCEACLTKARKKQTLPGTCKDCNAIKKQAERAKKRGENQYADTPPETTAVEETAFLDEIDHNVPEQLQDAFKSLQKFQEMDSLCRSLQKLIDETAKLPGGEQLARFVKATGSGDNIIHKNENLNALKRDLKGTRPYSVCPRCKGKRGDCKGCDGRGWVSKTTWDSFEDAIKQRLL